jgi:predicted ABC-type ATPase
VIPPTITLVAGPNGSGKSTLTAAIPLDKASPIIDPDVIARDLDRNKPSSKSIPAARQTILLCRSLIAMRSSFVLESTLAGNGALSLLRAAKLGGYKTRLIYVALREPELHVERVRLRVSLGGHDIPDVDIRRRYGRSLQNAPKAMMLADEAVFLDNSGPRPQRIMVTQHGRMVWRAATLPDWANPLLSLAIKTNPESE